MKPLKPTMREKKRYLLIKGGISEKKIIESIKEFGGILGLSNARPFFIEKNKEYLILCINRKALNLVRASFAICKEEIKILAVSGTLKKIKQRLEELKK